MSENIMDKDNEAEKANEDTVMADKVNNTEEAAKNPVPEQQQKKKKKKKKKKRRVRSQASFDWHKERVCLRSMGLPIPPPPPQRVRAHALPPKSKRNQRHPGRKRAKKAKKDKKASYEAAKQAAEQAEEGPVAASFSLPATTHPTTLEKSTVPETEDEKMGQYDDEADFGPTETMTLIYRGKTYFYCSPKSCVQSNPIPLDNGYLPFFLFKG
ncbi:hypothetical protein N7463_006846 [Penicillium fimorum]|uniref:Uncharacterized protein n=1 Tax=Penicillium fimorum TaxID=1882269 RepID=A0A9W9XV66_9EURO|nr:hypothetical protein N7463_006846 [Penicillium fimorum]